MFTEPLGSEKSGAALKFYLTGKTPWYMLGI